MNASAVVEVTGVTKTFGQREVLSGIDLVVREHEAVVLIGASGSGKSTLLRCIDLLDDIDRLHAAGIPIGWELLDNPWEACNGLLTFDPGRFPDPDGGWRRVPPGPRQGRRSSIFALSGRSGSPGRCAPLHTATSGCARRRRRAFASPSCRRATHRADPPRSCAWWGCHASQRRSRRRSALSAQSASASAPGGRARARCGWRYPRSAVLRTRSFRPAPWCRCPGWSRDARAAAR